MKHETPIVLILTDWIAAYKTYVSKEAEAQK